MVPHFYIMTEMIPIVKTFHTSLLSFHYIGVPILIKFVSGPLVAKPNCSYRLT